jgi:hypothetical protein
MTTQHNILKKGHMMTTPVYRTTNNSRNTPPIRTPQTWSSINPANTLAKARKNVLLASTTKEFMKSLDGLLSADGILKQQSHSHDRNTSSSSSRGCSTNFKMKRRNAMDLINHPVVIDDEDPEEEERRNVVDCSDNNECLHLDSTFLTSSKSSSLSSSLGPPLVLLPTKYEQCEGTSISLFDSKAISEETSCARRPHVLLGEMERTSNKHSDHEEYDSTGDDDLSTACTTVSSICSSDNCLPSRSFYYARLLKSTSQSSLTTAPQSAGWMRRIQQSHDESHREEDTKSHSRSSKNGTITNGSAEAEEQPRSTCGILRGNDDTQSGNFCTLSRTSWEIQKMQEYNEKQGRKSKRSDMLRRMKKNFFSGSRLVLPKNSSSNSLFDNILPNSDDDDDDYSDVNEEKDFEEEMRARTMILQILQRREDSNLLNGL